MAHKIVGLRIFSDADDKMNLDLTTVGGDMLVVSQFTLYGQVSKGRRPSFENSASADDAELLYDHETPAESRLSVTIQAASVDMFHERLNNHLKADDFFAVEKYPTMTFVSTQVEPLSDDKARVTGDFTMLGKTLPMTLDVFLIKYAPHPMSGKQAVGFEATGTIDRTDFGMTYRAPFVGEEVRFTITMEARVR